MPDRAAADRRAEHRDATLREVAHQRYRSPNDRRAERSLLPPLLAPAGASRKRFVAAAGRLAVVRISELPERRARPRLNSGLKHSAQLVGAHRSPTALIARPGLLGAAAVHGGTSSGAASSSSSSRGVARGRVRREAPRRPATGRGRGGGVGGARGGRREGGAEAGRRRHRGGGERARREVSARESRVQRATRHPPALAGDVPRGAGSQF